MKTEFKLENGEQSGLYPVEPIITITGTGKNTYLWIGNNAEGNKLCFATLSGKLTLRTLANNILNALDSK